MNQPNLLHPGRRDPLRARGVPSTGVGEGVDGQVAQQAAGRAVRLRHRDPPRGNAQERQEPRRETIRAGTHQGTYGAKKLQR